jgi:hypothetical protein
MRKPYVFISVLIASSLLAGSASLAAPVKLCDLLTPAQATGLMGGPASRTLLIGGPLVTATGTRGCYFYGPSPSQGMGIQILSAAGFGVGSTLTPEQVKLSFTKDSIYPVDLGDASHFKRGDKAGSLELQVLLPGDKEFLSISVSEVNQESDATRVRPVMVQIAKTVISILPAAAPGQPAAPKVPKP